MHFTVTDGSVTAAGILIIDPCFDLMHQRVFLGDFFIAQESIFGIDPGCNPRIPRELVDSDPDGTIEHF